VGTDTKIMIQGITGREASVAARQMLAYGTSVIAGVTPGRGGQYVEGIPVYDTVKQVALNHLINTSMVYVPPAVVYDAVLESMDNGIKLIVIMTKDVPLHDMMKCLKIARDRGVQVIGPSTVGIISPGAHIKIGNIGGGNVERIFTSGCVGIISRSGEMAEEIYDAIKMAGYGVSTAIDMGSGPMIGSAPVELMALYEGDLETKAVVMYGEPGVNYEKDTAEFLAIGGYTKPLIVYMPGCFARENKIFPLTGFVNNKPYNKLKMLQEAGAYITENSEGITKYLQSLKLV